MGLRLAAADGVLDEQTLDAVFDYQTSVPLFASGAEAAAHGRARIERPPPEAVRTARRLKRKLGRQR